MPKDVKVEIVGDASKLKKSLNEAEAATGKFAKSTGDHSRAIAAAATAAAVGVGAFAADVIDAASDYSETVSKSKVIFDEASDAVTAFAESAATSLGLSQQAALDAAATFAIFGKGAGIAGEDLAGFSTGLTTLAADMASFSNTSPEQAIEAIGAALRGESEPIRAYGVLLDDATLKARAMTLGIYDGTGSLTQQQRVLAAQAEIMAQTSDAQGDFTRTSGGLAGQQKILAAEFDNLKISLGDKLLPVAVEAVKVFNKLAFGGDATTETFDKFGKALERPLIRSSEIVNAFGDLVTATGEARSGVDKLQHGIGSYFDQLAGGSEEANRNFRKAFGDLAARMPEDAQKVVDAFGSIMDAADNGSDSARKLVDYYGLTRDMLGELAMALPEVTDALADQSVEIDHGAIGVANLNAEMEAQSRAATNAARQAEALAKRIKEVAAAQLEAIGSSGDFEQSIRDAESAYYDLQLQIEANDKAQKDSKLTDEAKAQSARDVASAVHENAVEVFDLAQKYALENGAALGSLESHQLMRDSLELSRQKYPELRDELNRYIAMLNLAAAAAGNLGAAATGAGGVAHGAPGFSVGGASFAQGGTVPGARGQPMLAVVHGGETITENGGNSGGGDTYIVNLSGVVGDKSAVIRWVHEGLKEAQRQQGLSGLA